MKQFIARVRRIVSRSEPALSMNAEVVRLRILEDRYFCQHYLGVYQRLLAFVPSGPGAVVEVGAGPGVVDILAPEVVRTDLEWSKQQEVCVDARRLPFGDGSLKALLLKDALHHIPDVKAFFSEARRTLCPGGRVIVMDPYWGPLARFVYRRLHPEPFDDTTPTWDFESDHAWSSNQALLFLVLRRDRDLFAREFPDFYVFEPGPCIGPSFLLSGGLYGRLPVPSSLLLLIRRWEERQARWLDPVRFGYVAVFEHRPQESERLIP